MTKTIDILGLGCAAVDDIIQVSHYPLRDSKTAILNREMRCGGLTAAALIAAARLGVHCSYAGCLGDNDPSNFVRQTLADQGVDICHAKFVRDARPISSVIIVDRSNGARNIFFDVSGLVPLEPGWPGDDVVRSASVLLVDHFNVRAQVRAAEVARQSGIPIVADLESTNGDDVPALLALADHLILSREFAEHITGCHQAKDAAQALWNPNHVAVVVTCGASGCWFVTRKTNEPLKANDVVVTHQPAFRVHAADTTGCGDVFHGAYAAALVQGCDIRSAVRFAAATAAVKATRRGGATSSGNRSEVLDLIEAQYGGQTFSE